MTKDTESVELLPCPWCGAEATAAKRFPEFPYPWTVEIDHQDGCPLLTAQDYIPCAPSATFLAALWNTRTQKEQS